MFNLNRIQICGNVGLEPEYRMMQNGKEVGNLSVCVNESWKDKNTGEWKSNTEWFKVVIYNTPLVDKAKQRIRKGTPVYIEGKIKSRKYQDKNTGVDRYVTEVVLQGYDCKLHILEKKGDIQGNDTSQVDDVEELQDDIPF